MTFEKIKKLLDNLGEDVYYYEKGNRLHVTFNDFEGFDDNYHEIEREYDDEEAVDNFFEVLDNECTNKEEDFYTEYTFEGFTVIIGYASYDI